MESTSVPCNNRQSIDLVATSDEESLSQIHLMSSSSSKSASAEGNASPNKHIHAKSPPTTTTTNTTTISSVKELFCARTPYKIENLKKALQDLTLIA